ncbi:MAG: preprotein translocase subunit SecA [Bacteroidetes bacterium GWF2_38_335]|nr:MAG: preprotein translocase subunit SecA [Bacteroidetes bacterium GWF2_38_335]OFY80497.1 MAG: preprotein translocase subunit SecA [Bacteroidetes bacterium RIFOXYA12_FULL_38_20]HBS85894.1 preprotein translocase subunit SecA [Bacteroidales bacterium]
MSIANKIIGLFLGNKSDKDIKSILPLVAKIKEESEKLISVSHDDLRAKSAELRQIIHDEIKEENDEVQNLKNSIEEQNIPIDEREAIYEKIDRIEKEITKKIEEALNDILPTAFALIKETARRFNDNEKIRVKATAFDRDLAATRESIEIEGDYAIWHNRWIAGGNEVKWEMVHYDVQLIGGIVLHQGKISEMATGEGKTLVATLPVFLNALSGRGVHLVTVNDYLARRDSEWMGPLYEFHGLTVDCIDKHQPNSEERKRAYNADITFGTNNEFGFDYLRDNMAVSPEDLVQRPHNYAIVDEVDSVLIDDARTPLIISGPVPRGDDQLFMEYKPKVQKLVNAQRALTSDLLVEAKKLISEGKTEDGGKLLLRTFKGLPKNKALIKFLSEQGMKALMHKTENVYMQNNSKDMHLITDELYFVIEEKNNSIELTEKGIDLITGDSDDPEFFILPDIGSRIVDIEKSGIPDAEKQKAKDKLMSDFAIKSERVHTVNQLLKAYTLFEIDIEYVIIDNKIKIVDEQTGRIMEGRRYSDGLHQAIEAKENVKVEAATQTFATITLQNYFRMYNKLAGMTGTAETEAGEFWDIYKLDVVVIPTNKPIVRKDYNDYIYKTKREKYNAVIDHIGKLVEQGRPVLVGTTSVEISELLSRMLKLRGIKHNVLNAKLHQREADIVAEAGKSRTVTIATNMAGRGTDIKLSKEVKDAGGLAIIGTERHESRRVDRQLRGRSGRQGDPGSSQFFVALEDDLMRLFGSDRIARLMDRMGLKEGEVIQHSMISKSIERAQKKVEENNFGIRKRLLDYDNVMNNQRERIYRQRRIALLGERVGSEVANILYDAGDAIVNECHGNLDYDSFKMELIRILSIECPIDEKDYMQLNTQEIIDKVYESTINAYQRKTEDIANQAYPVIRDVFERKSAVYNNIVVPINDGLKTRGVRVNLEKAAKTKCTELIRSIEKTFMLITIDEAWKEQLREMDDLKQSVQNASYEQKDPLLIYKFESFKLLEELLRRNNRTIASMLMKAHIQVSEPDQVQQAADTKRTDMSKYQTGRDSLASDHKQQEAKAQPVRVEKKVGRNDPCPCGSGKKYKSCHGISAE